MAKSEHAKGTYNNVESDHTYKIKVDNIAATSAARSLNTPYTRLAALLSLGRPAFSVGPTSTVLSHAALGMLLLPEVHSFFLVGGNQALQRTQGIARCVTRARRARTFKKSSDPSLPPSLFSGTMKQRGIGQVHPRHASRRRGCKRGTTYPKHQAPARALCSSTCLEEHVPPERKPVRT